MHRDAIMLLQALWRLEPLEVLRLGCRWAQRAAPGDPDVATISRWVQQGATGEVPVPGRRDDDTWHWAHQGAALTPARLCVGHLTSAAHLHADVARGELPTPNDLFDHAAAVAQMAAAAGGDGELPWRDVLDCLIGDHRLVRIAAGLAPGWRGGIDGLISAARLIDEQSRR